MNKLFHVGPQTAQTCDLLETLTKFLLYFLTTESDCSDPQHKSSMMIAIRGIPLTSPFPPLKNSLSFHFLHARRQASCVGVTVAVEAVHLLPQSTQLQAACCHLFLQQTALPLSHAHCFRVTGESRFLHGKLHGLQPGLQAAQGLEHFYNLYNREAERQVM